MVRNEGKQIPLRPNSESQAWFQIPNDFPQTGPRQTLEIFRDGHPIALTLTYQLPDRSVACFGALHQVFTRPVSTDDPASSGEVVHIFLTGLHGAESIPDGVPNPFDHMIPVADRPAFTDSGFGVPLFFGLAPGLIGIQQLDLRVDRPADPPSPLFSDVNEYQCSPVPVVAEAARLQLRR